MKHKRPVSGTKSRTLTNQWLQRQSAIPEQRRRHEFILFTSGN